VAGQVEESHLVGCLTKVFSELGGIRPQIDHGECRDASHTCHRSIIVAGEGGCQSREPLLPNRLVN
jgi:hypothetical protein